MANRIDPQRNSPWEKKIIELTTTPIVPSKVTRSGENPNLINILANGVAIILPISLALELPNINQSKLSLIKLEYLSTIVELIWLCQ